MLNNRTMPGIAILSAVLPLAFMAVVPCMAGPDLSHYPLRIHVYQTTDHSHYAEHNLRSVDGDGRGNLFENGEPRGFEFSFNCMERMRSSDGWETYPAKWKKKDAVLEIVTPVMGKPGAGNTCELKIQLKDFVYYRREGSLNTEPASVFKGWMEKHNYDPEHGKNEPTRDNAAPGTKPE